MRYIFKFPDIGEGITEGKILEWYVKKGQEVTSGDSLVKMETDKVVTDIPSPKTGTVVTVHGAEGETINVEDPLVELEIEGEAGEESEDKPKTVAVEEKGAGVVGTLEEAGDGAHLPSSDEGMEKTGDAERPKRKKALATPVARAMAKDLGVDINQVKGTGPAGRVTKKDIQAYHDSGGGMEEPRSESPTKQAEDVETEPLSQIRKTIAKNMIRSKQTAAHMSVFEEVEVSRLIEIRRRYKESFAQKGVRLSYLPFIIKATALALKRHKQLNARLDLEKERMLYLRYYHIGIAVDTDDGLVVPVIRHADRLSVYEIARQLHDKAERARERKLELSEMRGGTFTITSYGSIGGLFAVPVINVPETGILGVGRLHKKPIVQDDRIVPGNILPLSLSVDHRVVDGGETARFLNDIMRYLSDPVAMFMDTETGEEV